MRHKLSTIDNMDITLIDTLACRINRVSQAHVIIRFVGIIISTIHASLRLIIIHLFTCGDIYWLFLHPSKQAYTDVIMYVIPAPLRQGCDYPYKSS